MKNHKKVQLKTVSSDKQERISKKSAMSLGLFGSEAQRGKEKEKGEARGKCVLTRLGDEDKPSVDRYFLIRDVKFVTKEVKDLRKERG